MLADSALKAIRPSVPASLWLSEELEPRPLYLKALTESQPPRPLPRPARQSPGGRAPRRKRQPVCRGPLLPLGGRIKQGLRPGSSAVTSSSCLSPPARLLSPNPPPPHGPGRLTGLHCPCAPALPSREAGLGTSSPVLGSVACSQRRQAGGAARPAQLRGDVQIHPEDSSGRIYTVS